MRFGFDFLPEDVSDPYVDHVKDKNNKSYLFRDTEARSLISSLQHTKSSLHSQTGTYIGDVRIANNLFADVNGVQMIKNTAGYEIDYNYQNETHPAVVVNSSFHHQIAKWYSHNNTDDARSVVIQYDDDFHTPTRHLHIEGTLETTGNGYTGGKLQFDIPSADGTKYIHVCDTFTYDPDTEDGSNDTHTITYVEGTYSDLLKLTAIPILSTSLEAFAATLPLGVHHCFYNSEDYASDAPQNVHAFVDIAKYSENTGDMIFRPTSTTYQDKMYRRILTNGVWREWVEFSAGGGGGGSVDKYDITLTVYPQGIANTPTPRFDKCNGYTNESDITTQLHNLYTALVNGEHPIVTLNFLFSFNGNTLTTLCPVSVTPVDNTYLCLTWENSVPPASVSGGGLPATRYVHMCYVNHTGVRRYGYTQKTYSLT